MAQMNVQSGTRQGREGPNVTGVANYELTPR